jgi:hypothetical protein
MRGWKMKAKASKLDEISKVFSKLTEDGRDTLILTAKKLLKVQKANVPIPSPIEKKKPAD